MRKHRADPVCTKLSSSDSSYSNTNIIEWVTAITKKCYVIKANADADDAFLWMTIKSGCFSDKNAYYWPLQLVIHTSIHMKQFQMVEKRIISNPIMWRTKWKKKLKLEAFVKRFFSSVSRVHLLYCSKLLYYYLYYSPLCLFSTMRRKCASRFHSHMYFYTSSGQRIPTRNNLCLHIHTINHI